MKVVISDRRAFLAALLAALAGVALSLFVPGYLLRFIEHPDGSYLSLLLQKHQLHDPVERTVDYYAVYLPQVARRLILMPAVVAGAAFLLATRYRRQTVEFWNLASTPFNLAILRVVILSQVLLYSFDAIYAIPQLTAEGLNVPRGYAWLAPLLPSLGAAFHPAMHLFKLLGVAVLLGAAIRFTLPLFLLVSFFVMLGPHFVGKMNHYHHLWLGSVILLLGPCADAISLDDLWRRWRRKPRPAMHESSAVYGRPFVFLWMIMGAAYFFPGYWKFVTGGLDWAFSDNVRLKILAKAFEVGTDPAIALYNHPWLCRLGGLATLVFEMSFPFAMIFPRGRLIYGLGGIGFHEVNRQVMQIAFTQLEWFYVSFVDWSGLLRRRAQAILDAHRPARWTRPAGLILLAGMIVTGLFQIDSWPWACYPTFAALELPYVPSIEIWELHPDLKAPATFLLQDDPNLIRAYTSRTRLRSYLGLVMTQRDAKRRAEMVRGLFEIWKLGRPIPPQTRFQLWEVQIPLWPRDQPASPTRLLGEATP